MNVNFIFILQLLLEGTQLLSELLDDSSLNILIDQIELVGFSFLNNLILRSGHFPKRRCSLH